MIEQDPKIGLEVKAHGWGCDQNKGPAWAWPTSRNALPKGIPMYKGLLH
jgi:hypothetical protein